MMVDALELPTCGNCDKPIVEGIVRPKVLAHIHVSVYASEPEKGASVILCSWECLRTWAAETRGGGVGEPIQVPTPLGIVRAEID